MSTYRGAMVGTSSSSEWTEQTQFATVNHLPPVFVKQTWAAAAGQGAHAGGHLGHGSMLTMPTAPGIATVVGRLELRGSGTETSSRRSDQVAYPSHARPNPTGTAASGASAIGSSAKAGDATAPKPSRPPAQREGMPARNVAMPNSRPPRM